MSNAKVKELINSVDLKALAAAMKDARDEVRDKVIPNMTKTIKTQFEQFEEEVKKVKKSDLKDFKTRIEKELKNLWK
jgi:flagellar motor switch protein FliG